MRIELFPIDFSNQGGFVIAADEKVHRLATEYAAANLTFRPNLTMYNKCWLAATVDASGEPLEAVAIVGFNLKIDVSLVRVSDQKLAKKAYKKIFDRLNSYFADTGNRGQEVMLYISDSEEEAQRCPGWKEALEAYGFTPAERYKVTVK